MGSLSGFICHDDYLAKTAKLTDEEVGRLFRALMSYHATGETTEITGREWLAFDFIKEDIDRAEEAHEEKCRKNRENRLNAIENERQRSSTNENDGQRSSTYKDKEKDNDKDKEKEKDNDNKKRFDPPTLEEVTAYMKEIGCDIDPQYFLDYQEARNWVLSNGKKAKDWKAVIRTWKHNDFKRQPTTGTSGVKKVVAQMYTQSDYTGVQEEVEERWLDQVRNAINRETG